MTKIWEGEKERMGWFDWCAKVAATAIAVAIGKSPKPFSR